jgi:hypothetical protein
MRGPVDNVVDDDAADNNMAGPGSIRERRTSAVAAAAAFQDLITTQDATMTMTTIGGYGLSQPWKREGKDEEKKMATTVGMEVEGQGGGGQSCNNDDNKG